MVEITKDPATKFREAELDVELFPSLGKTTMPELPPLFLFQCPSPTPTRWRPPPHAPGLLFSARAYLTEEV